MRVQKTSEVSFQKFIVDDKGKDFLIGLYNATESKSHSVLTDELRIFRQTINSYAKKMEEKGIDIVFTSYPSRPNLSEMPALQMCKEGKLLEDTTNAPSELLLLELQHDRTTEKPWSKLDVKKWFNRANAETKGWFTLSYLDRFKNASNKSEDLIMEAGRPSNKKEIVDAIFD